MLQLKDVLENPEQFEDELSNPLPFLFPNNQVARSQWKIKLTQLNANHQNRVQLLKRSTSKVPLLKSTKTRLEKEIEIHEKIVSEVNQLFSELHIKGAEDENLKSLLAHRIPSNQHLESYYLNIFRDWSWGERENSVYNRLTEKMGLEAGCVLILGGGAGRLAYDLTQILDEVEILQMDINPLLSLIGHKMSKGESLKLTEMAAEIKGIDSMAAVRDLKGPGESPGHRLSFAIGDASNHPFRDAAFHGLITPWLIDIIPEPFESFSRRMNGLLKEKGEWISFGPLSFEKQPAHFRLSSDEVLEQLEVAGFDIVDSGWVESPYLQSPLRAQHRTEHIFHFKARKIKACKKPGAFHYYPEWFENGDVKVPLATTNIESLFTQRNLEASILGQLSQGLTMRQIIGTLSKNSNMNDEQSESLIVGSLNRLIESGEIVSK